MVNRRSKQSRAERMRRIIAYRRTVPSRDELSCQIQIPHIMRNESYWHRSETEMCKLVLKYRKEGHAGGHLQKITYKKRPVLPKGG